MLPSAAELIAHYLRANNYTETLRSFIKEAGLSSDIGASSGEKITIETVLQEKKTFDLSLNFEKLDVNDKDQGWTVEAPTIPMIVGSIPNRSNILSVSVFDLRLPSATSIRSYVAVSTADRQLHLMDPSTPALSLACSYSNFQDSPSLDVVAISSRHLLVASMSGKLTLFDLADGTSVDERRDHSKYLVKLATWSDGNTTLVASAGWDSKIFFYQINVNTDSPQLGDPVATLTLASIPETTAFITSPENGSPILLVARRDSTFLHYYSVALADGTAVSLLGKQNLAPHSNAWVAFTPADIQICPTNPYLVAVATSSTPHMKLLVVKLLVPPTQAPARETGSDSMNIEPITQASQARAELMVADQEECAILISVNTLAPQTSYSTPRLVWRPDGSGVYVSSDDGIVRGIEVKSGKISASLEGHEPGSKLRCLWAGRINMGDVESVDPISAKEYLISGGFDQKLILWVPS